MCDRVKGQEGKDSIGRFYSGSSALLLQPNGWRFLIQMILLRT